MQAIIFTLFAFGLTTSSAHGHASNQALVMLLPTDIYIGSGVLVVALTALFFLIPRLTSRLRTLPSVPLVAEPPEWLATVLSLISLFVFVVALIAGLTGSRDPLVNPLPLLVWTVWWVGLVFLQGLVGNFWAWINPLTGIFRLIFGSNPDAAPCAYPTKLETLPAIVGFLLFSAFMLAHPAPEDPSVLAIFAASYWVFIFVAAILFGPKIALEKFDFTSVLASEFSRSSVFGIKNRKIFAGIPGWKFQSSTSYSIPTSLFILIVLATSSFDGFNETFAWLAVLDINPLEFPGRSATISETVIGLILANAALVLLFALTLWLGFQIARARKNLEGAIRRVAPAVIPIAIGYHFAHFLTYFLVNGQYAIAAASDPFTNGSDYLALGQFYVTTGFFNTPQSVEKIFLAQAFAVVAGHVISIIAAHLILVRYVNDPIKLTKSQIPMAAFMIAYTFFGLWLLAAPRGA